MKNRIKHMLESDMMVSVISSLLAIVVGLLVGLIILIISNPKDALSGFITILSGGFAGGMKGIGDVLYFATPIMMTGLAVGFAFKTGLFNIGAPGQFIVGAFCAIYVGIAMPLPEGFHWVAALVAGGLGGAIWGMIPGLLKAFMNVNEVIASIMLNYIGLYAVNMSVKTTPALFDQLKNQSKLTQSTANIPKLGFDKIFDGSSVNAGIVIAIIIAIVMYIILYKTTFGYELRACGLNRHASKYAGINEKKSIVASMLIAGALAGLGGALLFLAGSGKHIEIVDMMPGEGFDGIPVALLGLSNPIGIIFSSLFIAYIDQGGFYMQLYDYPPEIINIIVASIVYCSACSLIVRNFVKKRRLAKELNNKDKDE